MLPNLTIKFDNGNAGTVETSPDGIFACVATASATDSFELSKPYLITGMGDVAKLGILPTLDNKLLYDTLFEYYQEAGEGTTLYLMGMPDNNLKEWFSPDTKGKVPVERLLNASNGNISCIFTKGADYSDLAESMSAIQTFADNYTAKKYAPFFTLLEQPMEALEDVLELPTLNEMDYNRVGVFIGKTSADTLTGEANHILAGRLAKIQVHENPGKVKLGALSNTKAYIGGEPAEDVNVEALHDKGYITFRTHVRKAGYYITDDPLATGFDDDYHYITRRRVIDKAYKIAYNVGVNEVLNDFDLMPDGTISPIYAKAVETAIEGAIYQLMTARGELSVNPNDSNDLGVKAKFNLKNNVQTTGRLEMTLQVRPKGHNRFFEILLGYMPVKN